ncbi:nuclear transport factor 2 family protein [Streptomyces sp. NPDC055952]|uniref:nuclear transport factor 2 family protein n=1 Tax=Streptomyces sp. NPDC055952 TaxID=3345663 RepID=UPI0035D62F38
MSTTDRPTAAEDFAGYLRAYYADAFDGTEPVEEVWDRYHLPEGSLRVNGEVWDRKKILGEARSRRSLRAPHELHVHEVVAEGRRAAARYTVSTPMLWKVQSVTEAAVLAEMGEDGRVARMTAFFSSGLGWSSGAAPYDSGVRPAPGTAPAPAAAPGTEPTPAQDPAHYLRAYYAAGYDPAVPVAEAHDRFHTPDAVHQVGGKVMQRSGVLKALEDGRRRGHRYPVDVRETLREGDRFAAHYLTSRDGNPDKLQEVLAFGEFAPDGRVRVVRFALQPGHGAA